MTKALHVRIESTGEVHGTHVYDADDGARLDNVLAVRFDHRIGHAPVVVLELQGGALASAPATLGLAEAATKEVGP
jgi:hypothetical protein